MATADRGSSTADDTISTSAAEPEHGAVDAVVTTPAAAAESHQQPQQQQQRALSDAQAASVPASLAVWQAERRST